MVFNFCFLILFFNFFFIFLRKQDGQYFQHIDNFDIDNSYIHVNRFEIDLNFKLKWSISIHRNKIKKFLNFGYVDPFDLFKLFFNSGLKSRFVPINYLIRKADNLNIFARFIIIAFENHFENNRDCVVKVYCSDRTHIFETGNRFLVMDLGDCITIKKISLSTNHLGLAFYKRPDCDLAFSHVSNIRALKRPWFDPGQLQLFNSGTTTI